MRKTIKRIWNWISSILVAAVVLLAVALVGVRIVGLQPYVVLSGSMEPTYPVGSLIYVKSTGLNVEILGSAIQADGMGATSAQEAWEIASNSQGGA